MFESFIIHAALGIIQAAVKNPARTNELKHVLIAIRDGINGLFPGE